MVNTAEESSKISAEKLPFMFCDVEARRDISRALAVEQRGQTSVSSARGMIGKGAIRARQTMIRYGLLPILKIKFYWYADLRAYPFMSVLPVAAFADGVEQLSQRQYGLQNQNSLLSSPL